MVVDAGVDADSEDRYGQLGQHTHSRQRAYAYAHHGRAGRLRVRGFDSTIGDAASSTSASAESDLARFVSYRVCVLFVIFLRVCLRIECEGSATTLSVVVVFGLGG